MIQRNAHTGDPFAEREPRNGEAPLIAALQAINRAEAEATDERSPLICAKIRGLMRGYDARWRDNPYRPIAVEQMRTAPLVNPETNATSRTFFLAGKLDVRAIHKASGRSVLIDHKTTSDDIADPNAPYWRQLAIEGQVSQYMLLEWMNGNKIDDAVWDVIRKPSISPKKLSQKDRAGIASLGVYCGTKVSQDAREHVVRDERESLELYELRLAHDCIHERPERYFARRSVPRLDAEILEYATEAWWHSQDMIVARRNSRHPRNPGACLQFGSPCRYLGICSGMDTPDSDKWQRKENVHSELPELDGDGKNVLTNSRIRCFQLCRKKHFFQYELGLERQDEEEREALYLGSLLHLALNNWWAAQIEELP